MSDNYFADLSKVNVTAHVEKKGQFSYLSWPFAVQELGKIDPQATWTVERHNGMPYIATPLGYFVEVSVTCKGVRKSQIHPVLDQRNQPIKEPNAFHINTSIQRALVKAIALHGLGLYIYAGEDLPDGPAASVAAPKHQSVPKDDWDSLDDDTQKWLQGIADSVRMVGENKSWKEAMATLEEQGLEATHKVAVWSRFDSKERAAMEPHKRQKKAA